SEAEPMGMAFTYQGGLTDANQVADGLYDFQFKLFDDPCDPCDANQVGPDVNRPDVDVVDGYFTVELDFGSDVFDGNAVWLEIGVRPGEMNDPCAYTVLSPRQEVTAVPYALQTRGIFVDNAGSVGVGTTNPGERLDVNGNININSVYKIAGSSVLSVRGTRNILVGVDAGTYNTGSDGTFLGYHAGYNNDGNDNTFLGYWAGRYNTTGHHNTFVGSRTGCYNTMGNYNTFLGSNAGSSNTTGASNTFLGNYAGCSNTRGAANTFLGKEAGYSNEEGVGNVFLGYRAGYNETSSNKLYIANSNVDPPLIYGDFAAGNVGIGTSAPSEKLDVSGNININSVYKIAGEAVLSNSGTDNLFVGVGAGANNTVGERNTFSGYRAGYSNTIGEGNTFLGGEAGYSNNNAGYNTFIGFRAGRSNTSGASNTFLGPAAGYSHTTGHYNTFLGYNAGAYNETGAGNVFIGNKAGSNETGSNKLYIANDEADANVLIYGDFSTGNVGIGTTSPSAKLEVNGTVKATGFAGITGDLIVDANVHVEGELAWQAKTGYISVSAAGFRPTEDGYDFSNPDGVILVNTDSLSDYYTASVQLPHGATATKLTYFWRDFSGAWDGDTYVRFLRTGLSGMSNIMAAATSSGSGGNGSSYDDTIDYATIDNSQYAYHLWCHLPYSDTSLYGVIIEYTFTEPY
ncbi:MAG: autotransporter outer membrane beta-barrel domain-containing protein, partial [Planctomycetota bacterium]